jgi:mitochondrial import receptor subunit TOM40
MAAEGGMASGEGGEGKSGVSGGISKGLSGLRNFLRETGFLDLPQPVKYEELQKEAFLCLKPEMFEGARLDFVKPLSA